MATKSRRHATRAGPESLRIERTGVMAESFVVTCGCGQCLAVGPAMAGGVVDCDCGGRVAVPSLSKLRQQTGADPYESGPIDTIRRMLAQGELPAGTCAVTGRPTRDVLDLTVIVSNHLEQTREARIADTVSLTQAGFLGVFFRMLRDDTHDYRPVEGTEILVPTPLYLDARHHRRARKARLDLVKRWLRTVPIYGKLLDAFPHAIVTVAEAE